MIRSNNTTLERRIKIIYDKTEGIQKYDSDNAYPQRVKNIISNSGTASSCVKLFAKFIQGDGFSDRIFWKTKVNKSGQTIDKLLYKNAVDYAFLHGFAILVGYNALLEPVSWDHVPFEFCRQGQKDDDEYNGKIILYNNWDKTKGKVEKKKFDIVDVYNPLPEVIQAQIDKAGGIEKYKGQIFWHSFEGDTYPKAPCDAVLEDIETDAEIKKFRNRDVTTNFMGTHMIEYPYKFETPGERSEEQERWSRFQGAENAGKMMIVENDQLNNEKGPGYAVKVTPFEAKDNDKRFDITNRTTKDSIIESYGQPQILLGISIAGKLGMSQEIQDAMEFYNNFTLQDRRVFEEAYMMLFADVTIDGVSINPSGKYNILPLTFGEQTALQRIGQYMVEFNALLSSQIDAGSKVKVLTEVYGFSDEEANQFVPQTQNSKPALINTIGIGGVTALTSIIQSAMTPEQKINTLVVVFGLTPQEAGSMVNSVPTTTAFA